MRVRVRAGERRPDRGGRARRRCAAVHGGRAPPGSSRRRRAEVDTRRPLGGVRAPHPLADGRACLLRLRVLQRLRSQPDGRARGCTWCGSDDEPAAPRLGDGLLLRRRCLRHARGPRRERDRDGRRRRRLDRRRRRLRVRLRRRRRRRRGGGGRRSRGDGVGGSGRGRRRRRSRRQQPHRVDVPVRVGGDPDAEMDVRGRRGSVLTRPDRTDRRALDDGLAPRDGRRPQFHERHGVAVARLDRDAAPHPRERPRERDRARGRRADRRPETAPDVDAAVLAARVRIRERERPEDGALARPRPRLGRRRERERGSDGEREAEHGRPPMLSRWKTALPR